MLYIDIIKFAYDYENAMEIYKLSQYYVDLDCIVCSLFFIRSLTQKQETLKNIKTSCEKSRLHPRA